MSNLPQVGEIWKHFDGTKYEILQCPVIQSETGERLVCYKRIGTDITFALPIVKFKELVDKEKHHTEQTYIFEKVS